MKKFHILTLYLTCQFLALPMQQQIKILYHKYWQMGIQFSDWVENIVGKEEIALKAPRITLCSSDYLLTTNKGCYLLTTNKGGYEAMFEKKNMLVTIFSYYTSASKNRVVYCFSFVRPSVWLLSVTNIFRRTFLSNHTLQPLQIDMVHWAWGPTSHLPNSNPPVIYFLFPGLVHFWDNRFILG